MNIFYKAIFVALIFGNLFGKEEFKTGIPDFLHKYVKDDFKDDFIDKPERTLVEEETLGQTIRLWTFKKEQKEQEQKEQEQIQTNNEMRKKYELDFLRDQRFQQEIKDGKTNKSKAEWENDNPKYIDERRLEGLERLQDLKYVPRKTRSELYEMLYK